MLLQRFYDPKLAQASYLIGCAATGEALVVDANRDVARYVRAAADEGLRVTHVTETHIHADFVSGSRELAAQTGAQLLRPWPARGCSTAATFFVLGTSSSTSCTRPGTRPSI